MMERLDKQNNIYSISPLRCESCLVNDDTTCRQAVEEDQIENFEGIQKKLLVQLQSDIVGIWLADTF